MDQPTADKYIYAAKHVYLTAELAAESRGLDTPLGTGLLEWEIVEAEERFSDNATLLAKVRDFERYLERKIEEVPREPKEKGVETISGYVLAARYLWQSAVLFDIIRRDGTESDSLRHDLDNYLFGSNADEELKELNQKVEDLENWFYGEILPEDK